MEIQPPKNLNEVLKENLSQKPDLVLKFAKILGTPIFIICLTIFFAFWLIGNTILSIFFHINIDPAPFLLISTSINIYSAYTISVLMMAETEQRKRDEIENNHKHEINKQTHDISVTTLKTLKAVYHDLKNTIIKVNDKEI